jgi:hypothetical protein
MRSLIVVSLGILFLAQSGCGGTPSSPATSAETQKYVDQTKAKMQTTYGSKEGGPGATDATKGMPQYPADYPKGGGGYPGAPAQPKGQ